MTDAGERLMRSQGRLALLGWRGLPGDPVHGIVVLVASDVGNNEGETDDPRGVMDALDFGVSLEKLIQLLSEGAEGPHLDFKETLDFSKQSVVELAKDIGAFSACGGHIVIGVNDIGQPSTRFNKALADQFDDADLRQRMSQYLPPPLRIRLARHCHQGHWMVLLQIEPAAEQIAVFLKDGSYQYSDGKVNTVFREGDVFVRDGTRSMRWQQHHVRAFMDRVAASKKEEWLALHREELVRLARAAAGSSVLDGPAAMMTWSLDADTFESAVVEALRRSDRVPLALLMERLPRDIAAAAHESEDVEGTDVGIILDRIAILAAVAIRLGDQGLCADAIDVLHQIYQDVNLTTVNHRRIGGIRPEFFWLSIICRIMLLGAVAVRRRAWWAVRALAVPQVVEVECGKQNVYWIRFALTMAYRAGLLRGPRDGANPQTNIGSLVLGLADRLPATRRDILAHDIRLLDSIMQFDLLAAAVVIGHAKDADTQHWYPNFAASEAHRVEPAILVLMNDTNARGQLFPLGDDDLAAVVRKFDFVARKQVPWYKVWEGWRNPDIQTLLARYPAGES